VCPAYENYQGIINFHIGAELFAYVSCARHQLELDMDMKKTYEINSVALADSQQTRPWVCTAAGKIIVNSKAKFKTFSTKVPFTKSN